MDSDLSQEDLEAQVEAFMRRQAEIESGGAARKVEPGKVLGADEVSEEVSLLSLQLQAGDAGTFLFGGRIRQAVTCCWPRLNFLSLQEAKRMCREVVAILRRLKEQRDMSLNEVRLTVAIEDPRARERRLMGMEVRAAAEARRARAAALRWAGSPRTA
jgi:hypothetical protein